MDGPSVAAALDQQVGAITAWLGTADPALLYVAPADTEWTVMQLMAHVTEVLRYWPDVMVALAAEPGRSFGRGLDDSVRTGYVAEHKDDSVVDMVRAMTEAGAQASSQLAAIPDTGWSATGVHQVWGTISLPEVVQRVLTGHLPDHLAQAQAAYAAAQGHA
ncbi:MAG TPA: DinB family protein [Actinomycetota bacterium]|nr:DinB family protein [Actinomycetota bacterium]